MPTNKNFELVEVQIPESRDGEFLKINKNQKQTEVIDEIDFELPYNAVGKLFEGYVNRRLEKFFDYRKAATIKSLEDIQKHCSDSRSTR